MSKENATLVQSLYSAFAQGDVPGVLAAFHPDIVWNEAENFPYADGNPYIGPTAVLEGVFMRIGTEWESFSVDIDQLLDAGDTIVALGRYRGKHRAAKSPFDAQCVHVWTIAGGKVTRFQQYTDTAQAQQLFGTH